MSDQSPHCNDADAPTEAASASGETKLQGQDEFAELATLRGEVAALREQLATAQRERDEARTELAATQDTIDQTVAEVALAGAVLMRRAPLGTPTHGRLNELADSVTAALSHERDQQRERADRRATVIRTLLSRRLIETTSYDYPHLEISRADLASMHDALREPTALSTAHPPTCTWTEDDNGVYNTSCDESFIFIDAGPTENEMKFCCYCGKPLVAVPAVEQAARDEGAG